MLSLHDLAIDGDDLMTELDLAPGPHLGEILRDLLARAIGDPTINTRDRLLAIARSLPADDGTATR